MKLLSPKIYVVIMRNNTSIDFKRMKCTLNEITMDWGTVKFKDIHIFGKTRKIFFGHIPLWGWKKPFLVIREGDKEPISMDALPEVTQEDVEKWAKSKLIKTLGFDTPRETPFIGIITLLVLFLCVIFEILILAGVRFS